MLHVRSLDGAALLSLPRSEPQLSLSARELRHLVVERLGNSKVEAFDLVFQGQVLSDEDGLPFAEGQNQKPSELNVTIIWRPEQKILTASKQQVAIFQGTAQQPPRKLLTCGPFQHLLGASFSPDGSMFLISLADGAVETRDAESGETLWSFQGGRGSRRSAHNVIFSPDSRMVLVPKGSAAQIFDARTGEALGVCCGSAQSGAVRVGIFSPDSSRVLLISQDGFACSFSAPSGRILRQMSQVGKWNSSVHFFSSGDSVLTVLRDGTARIFELCSGDSGHVFRESGWISDAQLSRDDRKMLLVFSDCRARIHRLDDHDHSTVLSSISVQNLGYYISPYPVSFSRCASKLLFALDSCEVKVLDSDTGEVLSRCLGGKDHITSASFSADGRHVLVSYYNSIPKIFDASTGACVSELEEHPGVVLMAHFS